MITGSLRNFFLLNKIGLLRPAVNIVLRLRHTSTRGRAKNAGPTTQKSLIIHKTYKLLEEKIKTKNKIKFTLDRSVLLKKLLVYRSDDGDDPFRSKNSNSLLR